MPLPPSTSSIALRYLEAIDCANQASSLLEYAANQNQSINRSTTTSATTTTTPQTKSTTTLPYPLSPPTSRWIAPDDNAIANRSLLADVPSTQTYTPNNNKVLGTPSSGVMTATTVMTPSGSGSWTSSHSTHYKNRFRLTSATTTPTTATNTTVATSPSQRRRPRTWQQQQQLQQQLAMMNDATTLPENPVVVVATHHHHHAHHPSATAGEYSDESSLTSRRSETNEEDNGGYQQHHQDSSSLATNEDDDDDDNEDGNDHRIEDDDEEDDPRSAPWTSTQQKQTLLHQSRFSNLPRRQLDGVKRNNTPNLQAQHRKDPASTTRKAATNRLSDASWIKKKKRGPNDRSSVTPPLPQPTTAEPDNQRQPPPSSHDEGINQQLAPPTISALTANNLNNASIQLQTTELQQRPESATDQMSDFMAPTEIMTNRTTDLQYRRRGLRRPRPSQLEPLPPPQLSATTVIPRPNVDERDEHQLQLITSGFTCSAIPQHYFGQSRTSKTTSAGAVTRGIKPTTPTKTVSSSSSRNLGSSSNNPSTDSFGGRPWPPPSRSPRSSLFPRSFPQRHVETNSLLSDSSIEGGGSSAAIMGDAANTSATTNTSTTNTTNTNTAATMNSAAAIALPDKPEVGAAAKTTVAVAAALPTPSATNARPLRLPPAAAQSRKPPTASSSSVYHSSLPQPQQQESTSAVGAGINRNGSFQSQSITSSVGVETGVKTVEPSSVALKSIFTHRTAQATLRSRTVPIPPQAPALTATPAVTATATAQLQSRYKSTNASGRSSSSPPPPQPQQQDLSLPEFLQCHRLMSHRGSKSDGVLVAKTGRGEPIQTAQSHASSGWTPMSESGLISEDFSPSRPVQPLFFSNRIFEDSGTSPSKAFQHWMSKQNENRNESSGKALSEPSYPRSRPNYFAQQAARRREKNEKEQFDEDESKNGPPEVQRITRVDRSLNEIGGWKRTATTGKSSNQKVSVMGENPDPIFCPASPQETNETQNLPPSTVIGSNHRQVTQYDQTGDPQVPSLTPIRALLARRRQQRQWPLQEFTSRDETAEEKKGETEDSSFRKSTHTMTTPPEQSLFSSTRIDATSRFDGEGLTNKTKSIPKESVTVRSEPDHAKKSPLNPSQGFSLRSHALNRYSLRKKELSIEKASNEKVLFVKPSSSSPNVSSQEIVHQSLRSKLYGSASLITSPVARSPVTGKQNEQAIPVARAPEEGKRNEQELSKSAPTSKVSTQPEVPPPTSKGTVQQARSRFQHSLESSQPTKLETVNHHASSDGRIVESSTPPAESKQDNLDAPSEVCLSVKDRVRALALRIQPRDETVPIGRSSQVTAAQATRSTSDTHSAALSNDKTKSTSPTHEKTHRTTRQSLVMGAYLAAMAKSPPRYDDKGSKTQSTDISVDVPSIRSKFEGSILSHEEEEQDDESVSVKSRRSLFEVELTERTKESEVGKMRAVFESKKPVASQAKGFKGNGALKDAWAKFEASSSPPSDIALKRKVPSTQSTHGKQIKNNVKGNQTLDTSKDLSNAMTSLEGKGPTSLAHPRTCQPADHLLPVADDSRSHSPFGIARKSRHHDAANDNDYGALARKSEVPTSQIDTENYAVVSEIEGKHLEMVASSSGIKSDSESRQKPNSDKVSSDRSSVSETRQSEGGVVTTASPSKTMATTPAPKVNANVTPFSKRLLVHNRFKSFARKGRYAAMTIKSESGASDAVEAPTKPQNLSTNPILLKQQEEKLKAVHATSKNVLQVTSKAVKTSIKNGTTAAKAQPITGTSQSDTKSAGARQNRITVVGKANDHTNNDRSNVSGDKIVNIIPRDAVAVSTKPLKPEAPDRRPEECRSDSDYSDGVTLDVSIADVSCLTNPTAFRSKEGNSFQSASHSSSKSSFVADLMEAEAKQSEASSSQTSEAAAPLLAAALGLRRSSDDASAFDGFFSSRFLSSSISKWEHLARGDNLASDEKEPVVKPSLDIGKDSGWDLQHIRDSNSPASFKKDSFAKFDASSIDWNAFLADSRLRKSQPSPVDFIQNPSRSVTPQTRPSVSIVPRTEFLRKSSRELGVTRTSTPRSVTPTRQLTPTRPKTPTTPTMSLTPARPITPSSGNASRISHNMDGVRQSPLGVQMDALSHSYQRSANTPSRSTNTPSTAYSSHSHHSYMLPSVSPTARSPYASFGVSTTITTTTTSTSPHSRSPRATSTHSAPHYIGRSYQLEADWGGTSHSSTPLSHFPLSNMHMTPPVKIAPPPAPASEVGQTYFMSEGSTKTPSSLRRASPKHAALMSRMRSVKEARLLRNASPIGTPPPVAASPDLIGDPTVMNSMPPRESHHVPPTMSSSQMRASIQQHHQPQQHHQLQQQPQQQQQPPPTYSTSYRPTSSVGLQVGPGLPRYLPSAPPPPPPTSYRSYHTASATTALPPRREPHRIEDELSNSTRSSTRFGGINFDTLLEVD